MTHTKQDPDDLACTRLSWLCSNEKCGKPCGDHPRADGRDAVVRGKVVTCGDCYFGKRVKLNAAGEVG